MRSPFPGMDPFLEQRWGDFHTRFVTYLSDAMNPALPDPLRARVEERVTVEGEMDRPTQYRPDSHVYQSPRGTGTAVATLDPVLTATPDAVIDPFVEQLPQRWIEVIDAGSGGRVISVIELLSPVNKSAGTGERDYLRKQAVYLEGGVNLLEIDLLLSGRPVTVMARGKATPVLYHASLFDAVRNRAERFAISMREPLPTIALPLRPQDMAVRVDLQAVLELAYQRGYYATDIDYTRLPDAVPASELEWAAERIASWRAPR